MGIWERSGRWLTEHPERHSPGIVNRYLISPWHFLGEPKYALTSRTPVGSGIASWLLLPSWFISVALVAMFCASFEAPVAQEATTVPALAPLQKLRSNRVFPKAGDEKTRSGESTQKGGCKTGSLQVYKRL